MSENTHEAEVTTFFNEIDINSSGTLEVAEIRRLFGANAEAVTAELDSIKNGGNEDGVVSLSEFQSFFNNIKKNADTNGKDGDASVTKALKGMRITLARAPTAADDVPAPASKEMTAEEAADMPSGPEADKAALSFQNLQRSKAAKKKVEAKRAEVKAAKELAEAEEAAKAAEAEAPVAANGKEMTAEEAADMPSGPEADKAALSFQNLQRSKAAKKKVAEKRKELADAKALADAASAADDSAAAPAVEASPVSPRAKIEEAQALDAALNAEPAPVEAAA